MEILLGVADVLLKSTLLLAVAAAALLGSRRLSAGARHLTGLAALIGTVALVPLSITLPRVALPILPAPRAAVAPAPEPALLAAAPAPAEARPIPAAEPSAAADPSAARPVEPAVRVGHLGVVAPAGPELPDRGTLLFAVWAAGALVVLLRFAGGTWHVSRLLARATPVTDPGWHALADELRAAHGVKTPLRLLHTPEVSVALTAGVFSPVLLLPEDACDWSPERRRLVLLHEIAHVARRDCLALVVTALATAVYWFNPLVWLVASRMRREGERACDDLVLAAGARASDYAGELLAIMRSIRFAGEETLSALALTEGSDLEGRLRAILEPSRRRRAPSRGAARGAVLLAVSLTSVLAIVEPWSRAGRAEAASHEYVGLLYYWLRGW